MRKFLMSLLMAGSLVATGIGAAMADDASSAPAAASAAVASDTTASAPAA
ncbi:ammonia channel protein, partial [Burkholderia gladioli]|nr:ammonia channel protein [Burkholderia gladioli]